jgi:hypothetical protein
MRFVQFMAACFLIAFLSANAVETSAHPRTQAANERVAKDIDALYSDDEQKRDAAVQDLTQAGRVAIPLLVLALTNSGHPQFDRAFRPVATLLGEWRVPEAAPDLARLLGTGYPAMVLDYGRTDESMAASDPAFEPLVKIGDGAVPELKKQLILAHWPRVYVILRVLKSIGTPAATEVGMSYIARIESDLKIAKSLFPEEGRKH